MAGMPTRSPFPGMDPWLESHWGDLHHSIIQYSRDLIAGQLPTALFATVEEMVYLVASDEEMGRVRPDAAVFDYGRESAGASRDSAGGVAVAEPLRIKIAEPQVTLGHIEIRKLEGNQPLVTAIEVISPTNKLDARNRRRYIQKREAYYAADVNVVEIDLLRTGEPLIDVPWGRLAARHITPCKACIRRVPAMSADDEVEYYPLPLRQRLPRLRIPLRPIDDDVILDLQQPIDKAYEMGRYGMRLNYAAPPPGPALSADDAAWAAEQVRQTRV
jgi:hypothetical protein